MKVSAKGNASFSFCARPSRTSALTRSILLMASATFWPCGMRSRMVSMMALVPSVRPRCASTSRTIRSASAAPPQAAATMARSRRRRGLKRPGVSTNTIWACPSIATPLIRVRVVWTLCVTIETLAPTMRFSSVDFPAFGSPISATKPARVVSSPGHRSGHRFSHPSSPSAPEAPEPPAVRQAFWPPPARLPFLRSQGRPAR